MLYNNKSNIISPNVSSGNHLYKLSWKPPSIEWLKWNIDASRIAVKNLTSICLCAGINKGRMITGMGKKLWDVPVLVAEGIAIREALKIVIDLIWTRS